MFRKHNLIKLLPLCMFVMLLSFVISGCAGQQQGDKERDQASNNDQLGKNKIIIVRANWDDQISSTYVVENVLEKMGYDVEQKVVDAAIIWQSVANESADGMVGAWLPLTHGFYYERVKDKVVDLGINLKPTKNGWVVPKYVTINSIEDMTDPDVKKNFDGKIYGIEPGAGLMKVSETALKEYGLNNYELIDSSGTAMVASLKKAIDNHEWIVVTGWTPHWMWSRWDLKYLEDPKNIIQGEEEQYIATIVKKGLQEEAPAAYQFLDNFNWEPKHMESVMLDINVNNMQPEEAAEKFVKNNNELVNSWLPKGFKI